MHCGLRWIRLDSGWVWILDLARFSICLDSGQEVKNCPDYERRVLYREERKRMNIDYFQETGISHCFYQIIRLSSMNKWNRENSFCGQWKALLFYDRSCELQRPPFVEEEIGDYKYLWSFWQFQTCKLVRNIRQRREISFFFTWERDDPVVNWVQK